jgi:hypothetical protein
MPRSTNCRNEAQRDQHPPSKHQAEVGTNADLENYKALELNNGGTDIRLTKRDIYQ